MVRARAYNAISQDPAASSAGYGRVPSDCLPPRKFVSVAQSEPASVKAAPAAALIDMLALQRALDDTPKAKLDAGPVEALLRYTL